MARPWIRWMLLVNAVYDAVLGAAFLVAYSAIYQRLGIPPPNHPGYVQFPAALVLIFGVAFLIASGAPARHRDILAMGLCLKLAYAGVVLGHWFLGSIPLVWTVFGWVDLAFAGFFLAAWRGGGAPAPR
jgi:hypothetical protein